MYSNHADHKPYPRRYYPRGHEVYSSILRSRLGLPYREPFGSRSNGGRARRTLRRIRFRIPCCFVEIAESHRSAVQRCCPTDSATCLALCNRPLWKECTVQTLTFPTSVVGIRVAVETCRQNGSTRSSNGPAIGCADSGLEIWQLFTSQSQCITVAIRSCGGLHSRGRAWNFYLGSSQR